MHYTANYPTASTRRQLTQDVEQLAWTVKRCDILLKSISSRIATVRKLAGTAGDIRVHSDPDRPDRRARKKQRDSSQACPSDQCPGGSPVCASAGPAGSPPGHDPAWMPSNDKKASARTYGRKKVQSSDHRGPEKKTPGAPVLRSPFLKSILRKPADATATRQPQLESAYSVQNKADFGHTRRLATPGFGVGLAYCNLISGFRTFLVSTAPAETPRRSGARSLRDICLRRIPHCLDVEQDCLDDGIRSEGEQADTTTEIYTYLESLGTDDRGGFAGLRQVVRSHGVHLVAEAAKEKLLPASAVQDLLEVCKENNAVAECQALLAAWAASTTVLSLEKLHGIVDLPLRSGFEEFLFVQLEDWLSMGKITVTQVSMMDNVWRTVLQALTSSTTGSNAILVVRAYVLALTNAKHGVKDARNNDRADVDFLWSIARLLAAMIWMGSATTPGNKIMAWQLMDLICVGIHQQSDTSYGRCPQPRYMEPFLLAAIVSRATGTLEDANMVNIDMGMLTARITVATSEYVSGFLRDAAKIVAYVDDTSAKDMARSTVLGLLAASRVLTHSSSHRLQTLAIESARLWAQNQNDQESYAFAEEVEDLAYNPRRDVDSAATPASRGPVKYRWEAGLCEWIAATPHALARQAIRSEDSGICMAGDESPPRKRRCSSSLHDGESKLTAERRTTSVTKSAEVRSQRTQRARRDKAKASGKENSRPARPMIWHSKHCGSMEIEDLSDDELGF